MKEEKHYLTQKKFDEFKAELETLKTVRRKEVAENLEYAKALGDLSENAEYHEARDTQANIEDRISKLESIMKTSVIVSSHDTNSVDVGSVVTVQKEKEKSDHTYTIVGSEEADISAFKISMTSPLGAALIGRKKGEHFSVSTPSGIMKYTVVEIK
ncbi:transcription elongation factor GreA [Candidatus Parcubacteria bacterium]|nr:transcription elongation factor GreA [Candidatus Parcubacteria bacterium]